MQAEQVRAIVDQFQLHLGNRTRFQRYRVDGRPATLEEAYAIQDEILARALRCGDSVAGYKIGLTTDKMQKFCGVAEPIAGRILTSTVKASGATLRKADFHRLGIESELALRIGKEVPLSPANGEDLIGCVDAIASAFEIIDDRDADYAHLDASSIAAENSWNRGVVLGDAVSPAAFGDFRGLPGQLLVNGEAVASGSSDEVMNGPLWVLAWIARFAHAAGEPLRPGQWISTGSIIPTRFASVGDTYSFRVGSLPAVSVTIV